MGPGPLIGDAPISRRREVTQSGAMATGRRELDANLFGFRVGPYIELPLTAKWRVGLNGFTMVAVDSQFKFSETVLNAVQRGSDSEMDLLPGGYAGQTFPSRWRPGRGSLPGRNTSMWAISRTVRVESARGSIWAILYLQKRG